MHLQEVPINSFKASEDEEANDKVRLDNNPQKSQPEVKRRPNIVITENLIKSQIIKAYVRKKCSFFVKFGMPCFLETPVLRFALLPY